MDIIWFLIIGLTAGWLSGKVMTGRGFGAVGNTIVGALGAVFGGVVFQLLGFSTTGGIVPSLIVAFVGSVLLLTLLGFSHKRK